MMGGTPWLPQQTASAANAAGPRAGLKHGAIHFSKRFMRLPALEGEADPQLSSNRRWNVPLSRTHAPTDAAAWGGLKADIGNERSYDHASSARPSSLPW